MRKFQQGGIGGKRYNHTCTIGNKDQKTAVRYSLGQIVGV